MRRAAIFPAAFALALATTALQARPSIDDRSSLHGESNILQCIPELFCDDWYPTISVAEESLDPTLFSEAQSRFDAENREIPIGSRTGPAEDDHFALSNSLPPLRSREMTIEPYSLRRFDDIRVKYPAKLTPEKILPLRTFTPFVIAPSTQREPDLLHHMPLQAGPKNNLLVRDEVQIISSGFSPEYGDCLCGHFTTRECPHRSVPLEKPEMHTVECGDIRIHGDTRIHLNGWMPPRSPNIVQSPSTERPSSPSPIAKPEPAPRPTLE